MADGQKTEKPTPRRLLKARADGQFPLSREISPAISFASFVLVLCLTLPTALAGWIKVTRGLLLLAFRVGPLKITTSVGLIWRIADQGLVPFVIFLAAPIGLGLVGHLAMTRFSIHLKRLLPDSSRINPLQKVRSLLSQNLLQLGKSLFVLAALAYYCYRDLIGNLDTLMALPTLPLASALMQSAHLMKSTLTRAAYCIALLGLLDFLWQRRQLLERLKMTKHEVKEETKEQEGNPQTKQRIRKIQRDLARKQMMKEVANATAVVVNPTHYAVALRYLPDSPGAPRVVAKGKNYLAARIKQRAMENQVPIVENPPLARALYSAVDVGQEIPAHLYRAVAEILAYIQRLMGKLPGRA